MLAINTENLARAQSIALAKLLDLLQTSTSESTIRQVAATILRFTTTTLAAAAKAAAKVGAKVGSQPAAREAPSIAPQTQQPTAPPLLTEAEHAQLCADFPFIRQYPELPHSDPAAWAALVNEWKQFRAQATTTTRANAPPTPAHNLTNP